jgi:hypothetical protein
LDALSALSTILRASCWIRRRQEPLAPGLVGGLGLRLWCPREHGDDFGCGLGEDADRLADKSTEVWSS